MSEQKSSLPGGGIWNANWPIQIIGAAVLAALGVFMLLDSGRAELFAGLVFGGFLLVDGIRWAVTRIGAKQFGRIGEIESLRAGIGLLTAIMLFGLSFLDAITLSGVRLILAIGGIAYGLLGFVMVVLGMGDRDPMGARGHQPDRDGLWRAAAVHAIRGRNGVRDDPDGCRGDRAPWRGRACRARDPWCEIRGEDHTDRLTWLRVACTPTMG